MSVGSSKNQESDAQELVSSFLAQPFKLELGPLFRSQLIKLDNQQHLFSICIHHIVIDGMSLGVLVRDLSALYNARCTNKDAELPDLSINYCDYSVWEKENANTTGQKKSRDYWLQTLSDSPPVLDLPTDMPRPIHLSDQGATTNFVLPAALLNDLRELGKRHNTTLFMTLTAGLQLLLARYCRTEDVVIGTPVNNRAPGCENLIGLFLNTIVLRNKLLPEMTLEDWLTAVRTNTTEAFNHQDLPFEEVIRILKPERTLAHAPLFSVMLVLQNSKDDLSFSLEGLQSNPQPQSRTTTKFDLLFNVRESAGELQISVGFSTDLFVEETIKRICRHWKTVLSNMCEAKSSTRIQSLSILDEQECKRLSQHNPPPITFNETSVVERFFAKARDYPQHPALVFADSITTYEKLFIQVEQIALSLHALGVNPGERVGILLPRSAYMLAAVLATLRVRAVFVPLDVNYPAQRLKFLANDAQLTALVTISEVDREWIDSERTDQDGKREVPTLEVDRLVDTLVDIEQAQKTFAAPRPEDSAYVLYTSGSTGQSKGVEVTHAALANLLSAMPLHVEMPATPRILAATTLSFDISLFELFQPLVSGGTVVLADDAARRNPQALAELIRQHDVDIVQATPTSLRMLVDNDWVPHAELTIISGGEPLPADLAERLLSQNAQLYNIYGPTEATVYCSGTKIREPTQITIGKPLANMALFVVDSAGELCPEGVYGEIYIGGTGLAKGYLGRPNLNASAFSELELRGIGRQRLYRSGDLGRLLPNGEIELAGRIDRQVKVRGVRIELGEIEQQLLAISGIRQATVIVREDRQDDKRITAYVSGEAVPDSQTIISKLKNVLTPAMTPAAVVTMANIPITSSGKVDNSALPRPTEATTAGTNPPREGLERVLCDLFGDVLGVACESRDANFFELGGHSLLLVSLANRINQKMNLNCTLAQLFECPTVSGLAQKIEDDIQQSENNKENGSFRSISVREKSEYLSQSNFSNKIEDSGRASLAQARLWFLDLLEPNSNQYNMSFAYRLHGNVDAEALSQAIDALVDHHAILRTTFESSGEELHQKISPRNGKILTTLLLNELPTENRDHRQSEFISSICDNPYDLQRGPLFRAALCIVSEETAILAISMHHIVSDGMSLGIIGRDLSALYRLALEARSVTLAPLEITYLQYAERQHLLTQQDSYAKSLDYWRTQLLNAPSRHQLDTLDTKPNVQSSTGAEHRITLPPEFSGQLQQLSAEHGVSTFMALLSAWQILVARLSEVDDLVIGVPSSGRSEEELYGLVGFFVNTLPIRARIANEATVLDVLMQCRETLLGALTHERVPFDALVAELAPERHSSYSPLVQMTFATLLGIEKEIWLEIPEVTAEPLERSRSSPKFELSVNVTETDGVLSVLATYNPQVFSADNIERWLKCYRWVLEGMLADSSQRCLSLPLQSPTKLVSALQREGRPAQTEPSQSINELFAQQALRSPTATAVTRNGEAISYADLEARSTIQAQNLLKNGIGPGDTVALYMSRSINLVSTMLAVLKVGASYLPLPEDNPAPRLERMLRAAKVKSLIAGLGELQHAIALRDKVLQGAEPWPLQLIESSTLDHSSVRSGEAAKLLNPASTSTTAYVMFTSGTSGDPKGVMVPHGAVVSLVTDRENLPIDHSEVFLQLAPISFDASTFELWGALLNGARVELAPTESLTVKALEEVLLREGVTTLWLTASYFNAVIDERPKALTNLRRVLTGGEALSVEHVRRAQKSLPDTQFINGYGPTESTTFACCYPITELVDDAIKRIPIGQPIAGRTALVLDSKLQALPVGVPGELYIGGHGLAVGYAGSMKMTNDRFIQHPDFPNFGRLYRTGDRVVRLPDGNLDFLGRIDNQVKIRGHRIEPGEIDTQLQKHTGIRDSITITKFTSTDADAQLWSYVVPEEKSLDEATVRRYLVSILPTYLTPTHIELIEAIPKTANGKLDKAQLPTLTTTRQGQAEFVLPSDEIELWLVHFWQSLLGGQISTTDDFFDLGGHSMLAVRLMDRIDKHFKRSLPLATLFSARTIQQLAELIRQDSAPNSWNPLVQIRKEGSGTPLFLIHALGGHVLGYEDLVRHLPEGYPVYGLQARGTMEGQVAQDNLSAIAQEYLQAIRSIQPKGPYKLAGWSMGGSIAFEIAAQLERSGETCSQVVIIDTWLETTDVKPSWKFLNRLLTRVKQQAKSLISSNELKKIHIDPTGRRRRQNATFQRMRAAHREAVASYRPPKIATRLTLVLSSVNRSEQIARLGPTLGWDDLTSGGVDLKMIDASHTDILKSENAMHLAQVIAES